MTTKKNVCFIGDILDENHEKIRELVNCLHGRCRDFQKLLPKMTVINQILFMKKVKIELEIPFFYQF